MKPRWQRNPQLLQLLVHLANLSRVPKKIADLEAFEFFLSQEANKVRWNPSAVAFLILALAGKKRPTVTEFEGLEDEMQLQKITEEYMEDLKNDIQNYQASEGCTIDLYGILNTFKKNNKNIKPIEAFLKCFGKEADEIKVTMNWSLFEDTLKQKSISSLEIKQQEIIWELCGVAELATKKAKQEMKQLQEKKEQLKQKSPWLLASVSINIEATDEIFKIKTAALVLGVRGVFTVKNMEGKTFSLLGEGSSSQHAKKILFVALENFDPLWDEKNIAKLQQFIQALKGLPDPNQSALELTKEMKKNTAYLLPCFFSHHLVYSYIYYNQEDKLYHFIHCNRGNGTRYKPNKNSQNLIYVSSPRNIKEAAEAMSILVNLDSAPNPQSFYADFKKVLLEGKFNLDKRTPFPLKRQKINNCSFANLKSLLADILEEKQYKQLTLFLRKQAIDDLLKHTITFCLEEKEKSLAECPAYNVLIQYLQQKTGPALEKKNDKKLKLIWHIVGQLDQLSRSSSISETKRLNIANQVRPFLKAKNTFNGPTSTPHPFLGNLKNHLKKRPRSKEEIKKIFKFMPLIRK